MNFLLKIFYAMITFLQLLLCSYTLQGIFTLLSLSEEKKPVKNDEFFANDQLLPTLFLPRIIFTDDNLLPTNILTDSFFNKREHIVFSNLLYLFDFKFD